MLRTLVSRFSCKLIQTTPHFNTKCVQPLIQKNPSLITTNFSSLTQNKIQSEKQLTIPINNFLQPVPVAQEQKRTVTKFSLKTGKRRTVKAVIDRFYRLNCGNWIRTIAGRYRKRWKNRQKNRGRNMEHVFCNATQCRMLDKMVSIYYRKPKYFIKNPYEPYEWRENFSITRRKPWRPEGCDYE